MKLSEVKKLVEAETLWDKDEELDLSAGFSSDLMSDALALMESDALLLTGLMNAQVVRTAEMIDVAAILFVRGKKPREDVIELAKQKEIPLLSTKYTMYEASGILYKSGLKGIEIQ